MQDALSRHFDEKIGFQDVGDAVGTRASLTLLLRSIPWTETPYGEWDAPETPEAGQGVPCAHSDKEPSQ